MHSSSDDPIPKNLSSLYHTPHIKAKADHYTPAAKDYDYFNESNSESMNKILLKLIRSHFPKANKVLDVTCGTGSQVFYLTKNGFHVTGSDINPNMLEVAREKAKKSFPELYKRLHLRDMCSTGLGEFDVIISMFNAVGHLTKIDFQNAMSSLRCNLVKDGVYIFDIFNANYLRYGNNISKLTIDNIEKRSDCSVIREIQYSDIDDEGVLKSYSVFYDYDSARQCKIYTKFQTLQAYTPEELVKMLEHSGFKVLEQCGIKQEAILDKDTERMFTVAQAIGNEEQLISSKEYIKQGSSLLMTNIYKKGSKVSWKWSSGVAHGIIKEIYNLEVEKEIKGSKIKRNASEQNPAYYIEEEGKDAHVLKLKSELCN